MRFGALSALLLSVAASAHAYEKDTHYELTYFICRLACFSHTEAAIVASADAGIDEDFYTSPCVASTCNYYWHAMALDMETVIKRRAELWTRAVSVKDLVKLGQFFHYQQDVYAHAKEFDNKNKFNPYNPVTGHAPELRQADRPPYHVTRAYEMAKETYDYAKQFLRAMGRPVGDLPDSAMITLVDTQCKCYERGAILDMWEEVDPQKVGTALSSLCEEWLRKGDIKKVIRPYSWTTRFPMDFERDGSLNNGAQIERMKRTIVDYNFVTDPQPKTTTPGYQPPVAPPIQPAPDDSHYKIGNDDHQLELRSQTRVTLELVDTGERIPHIVDWCYSACLGKQHANHAACDASCDAACKVKHGGDVIRARFNYDADGVKSLLPGIDRSLVQGGLTSIAREAIDEQISAYSREATRYEVRTPSGHFCKPCGQESRNWGFHRYQVKASVVVVTEYVQDGGDKKSERKESESIVGTIDQPDVWTPVSQTRDEACSCKGETVHAVAPPPGKTPTEKTPAPGPQVDQPGVNPNTPPALKVEGKNMNEVVFRTTDPMARVYLPGGCVLLPKIRDYQAMYVVNGGWIGGTLHWVAGASGNQAESTLRVNCLEIGKKAPAPGVEYEIVPKIDPVLRRLALFTEGESFQGPWDQARTWLYTDGANLDTVNGRLIPPLAPGQFLKSLYELAEFGKVDFRQPWFSGALRAEFLMGKGASPQSLAWAVGRLADTRANDFVEFLGKDWAAYVKGIDPTKDDDLDRIAAVMRGVDKCPNPKVRRAAIDALSTLPKAAKATILRRSRSR